MKTFRNWSEAILSGDFSPTSGLSLKWFLYFSHKTYFQIFTKKAKKSDYFDEKEYQINTS